VLKAAAETAAGTTEPGAVLAVDLDGWQGLRIQQLKLWKFDSAITLCCTLLKPQGKVRGWVFGTISATGSSTARRKRHAFVDPIAGLDLRQILTQDYLPAETRLSGVRPHLVGDLWIVSGHEVREDERLGARGLGDAAGIFC
jgi:hypothetical protein